MRVLITGGAGFLGWHLRMRLRAQGRHQVAWLDRDEWSRLPSLMLNADAVIHLAGINRASDAELVEGNRELAEAVVDAAESSGSKPRIVYANSIHSSNDTPYGRGKAAAAGILAEFSLRWKVPFVNVLLPNLFGEHGRPGYNSFVATFVDQVINGSVSLVEDRSIRLLHAQSAAEVLIGGLEGHSRIEVPEGTATTVQAVLDRLTQFHSTYAAGELPRLNSQLEIELFNTYRAALFPDRYPIPFRVNSDERGWLVETARWHGSEGQTFVSITEPGHTRGEHYHLRKIERFVVISGRARIALRRVDTDEIVEFEMDGEEPGAVDMPIGWIHNITNIGQQPLLTQFWVNELFDPGDSDTYWEPVGREAIVS